LLIFEWESPTRELPKELEDLKVKEYDLPFPKTVEEAVAQVYGLKSLVNPNVQAEGIVWWNKEHELFEELDPITDLCWLGELYNDLIWFGRTYDSEEALLELIQKSYYPLAKQLGFSRIEYNASLRVVAKKLRCLS